MPRITLRGIFSSSGNLPNQPIPQVLPEPHELEGEPKGIEPAPETFEANVDSFFFTSGLPQYGHLTSPTRSELRRSSSNGLLHSLQTKSNNGIVPPRGSM